MEQGALDASVGRMLSPKDFFTEHWARRPVYIPDAGRDLVGLYGVEKFLDDLSASQPPPYLSIGAETGERAYAHHQTVEQVRAAVERGDVCPMRISRNWHERNAPRNWRWMRALFGSLCRATCMVYMSPKRSENVDLFLAGPRSHLGVHYDSSHTFTLQISGERTWIVDDEARVRTLLDAARRDDFTGDEAIKFSGRTIEVTLRPGDALYVPAYCVHGVSSTGWSVSLGLGLRAFSELDYVEYLIELIGKSSYLDYAPVESFPESATDLHARAKMELLARSRALLRKLEMAAVGSILSPVTFPETLSPQTAKHESEMAGR